MRINILAGGFGGSVSAMQTDLNRLHTNIENTIDDLKELNRKIRNVNGGVYNLETAVSDINRRIQTEEAKKVNLVATSQRISTFLSDAIQTDKAVASQVRQNQKAFLNDFPWLRPQDTNTEPSIWEQMAAAWNDFWGKASDWVSDLVSNVVDYIREHAVEVSSGLVAIVTAAVLTYVTGGAFLAALGKLLLATVAQAAIGAVISGVIALFTGGDFWDAFGDGFAQGFMWGGIFAAISSAITAIRGVIHGLRYADDVANVADDVANVADDVADDVAGAADDVANSANGSSYKDVPNTLTDSQKATIDKLDNIVDDHLKDHDFSGTLRDLQGDPVPKPGGGYWDHMGEMKDSYRGLQKVKRSLENSLKNPNLSDIDRKLLQQSYDEAVAYINKIEELFAPYGGVQ